MVPHMTRITARHGSTLVLKVLLSLAPYTMLIPCAWAGIFIRAILAAWSLSTGTDRDYLACHRWIGSVSVTNTR